MSRIRIALRQAELDAKNPSRGVSYGDILNGPSAGDKDYVSDLFLNDKDCKEKFEAMINHKFCTAMGDGTALLDGFRYYMIQDFLYLKHYATFKLEAYMKGTLKDLEKAQSHAEGDIKYAQDLLNTITKGLGVSTDQVEETTASDAIKNYIALEDDSIKDPNTDWLKTHVLLLPCMLGYYKIADRLVNADAVLRETVYYTYWIEPNHDASYAADYIDFINMNWKQYIVGKDEEKTKKEMRDLFKSACKQEIETFDTGLYPPVLPNPPTLPLYQIVTQSQVSRTIKSATSITGGESHLIGIDAEGKAILSVTLEASKPAEDNQKWVITKDATGYTFRSVGKDLKSIYLNYDEVKNTVNTKYFKDKVDQSAHWFIIPCPVADVNGSAINKTYQIIPATATTETPFVDTSKQDHVLAWTDKNIVANLNIFSKTQGRRDQVWIID